MWHSEQPGDEVRDEGGGGASPEVAFLRAKLFPSDLGVSIWTPISKLDFWIDSCEEHRRLEAAKL